MYVMYFTSSKIVKKPSKPAAKSDKTAAPKKPSENLLDLDCKYCLEHQLKQYFVKLEMRYNIKKI